MIPLKDINPRRRFPFITTMLILINILIFFYEISLGMNLNKFINSYALIPNNIFKTITLGVIDVSILITFITSIFIHGGWAHLIGNMLYLWIFGDNVEDKLGPLRFIFFYLLCGICSSIMHIFIDPYSTIPTIGASGAISGVLAAYLIMFPKAKVITLIPIFLFIQIAELSAFTIILIWFLLQFFNGILSLGVKASGMGGVAWWAHIGGFLAGIIFIIPFRKYR